MAPYGAGGAWKPAPGVSYWPRAYPGAEPVPMSSKGYPDKPRTPAEQATTSVGFNPSEWGPNPLEGPRAIGVGGRKFKIPREALVKVSRRGGVTWVFWGGQTYVFSESGVLKQSGEERAKTRFDLL